MEGAPRSWVLARGEAHRPQPVADTFWGDRHGQLEDPFGHRWNVDQHLRDVPHEEVVSAVAAAFGAATNGG
jgi:hypothetical protein